MRYQPESYTADDVPMSTLGRVAFVLAFMIACGVLIGVPLYRLSLPLSGTERTEIRQSEAHARSKAATVRLIYARGH